MTVYPDMIQKTYTLADGEDTGILPFNGALLITATSGTPTVFLKLNETGVTNEIVTLENTKWKESDNVLPTKGSVLSVTGGAVIIKLFIRGN